MSWKKIGYKLQFKAGRKWKSYPKTFRKLNTARDALREIDIEPYNYKTLAKKGEVRLVRIEKLKEVM
jgi:hypothetical protein